MGEYLLKKVENIVAKGEIGLLHLQQTSFENNVAKEENELDHYGHVLLLPQCFQVYLLNVMKCHIKQ